MQKLFNTLSKKKELLKAKPGKKLNLFVCGPTVYDYAHLGHARTYIAFDALVRFLRFQGYKVNYLQNITDIDDKIIKRARQAKIAPKALAKRFEKEYRKDMKALQIKSVDRYAKATDYIPEIISQVKRLLKKGYGYGIRGDGIYYDISKFKEYGKLSGRTSLQAQDAVSRIDDSVKKRSKGDFALWKFVAGARSDLARARARSDLQEDLQEPKWKSPWGQGRPGWHIEDTAITEKHFGPQYELHGGAQDLIFPHHEAEIAQMEAISGKKPMARHWLHTGFLNVEGEKMAKSLGNFITVQDFLKERPARVLRLLVLKTHYRSPINYSAKLLSQTERELERIDEFTNKLKTKSAGIKASKSFKAQNYQSAFQKALEDDFNAPKAIAVLFDAVNKGNTLLAKNALSAKDRKAILAFFKEADSVFGFLFSAKQKAAVPLNVLKLAQQREQHRKQGNWEEADALRKAIYQQGWLVEDTPQGPKLKKIS